MRWLACVVPMMLLASGACDKPHDPAGGSDGRPASTGTSVASEDAGVKPAATVAMPERPERPIPRPQTTVGSGMSIEIQQKAIAYMVAMRAPRPDDVAADPAYADDLAAKLKPIALSMDTGADKARMNRVEVVANGRQIDILMATGCDDHTPQRAIVNRAGLPLSTLVAHGVLVVRCNDARIQCLQNTRDVEDVLCTTAPRHK